MFSNVKPIWSYDEYVLYNHHLNHCKQSNVLASQHCMSIYVIIDWKCCILLGWFLHGVGILNKIVLGNICLNFRGFWSICLPWPVKRQCWLHLSRIHLQWKIDPCTTGADAICGRQAYQPYRVSTPPHGTRSPYLPPRGCQCSSGSLNMGTSASRPTLTSAHRYNATTAAIFQFGKGWDAYTHACARELWLICTQVAITLVVSHVRVNSLTTSATQSTGTTQPRVSGI